MNPPPDPAAAARNPAANDAAASDAAEVEQPLPAPAVQRAIRCRMLCLLWVFPTTGASVVLINDARRWLQPAAAGREWPGLESWLALVLVLAHVVLGVLAWRSRRDHPGTGASPPATTDPCLQDSRF